MEKFVVDGARVLDGEVSVHGSKNAVLPMMAATLLNAGISVIENVPCISDVESMLDILKSLGCKCSFDEGILVIDSKDARPVPVKKELAEKVRTSILFCGAMLARFGQVAVARPGGCSIGSRPIDIHLAAFEKMGVSLKEPDNMLLMTAGELLPVEYRLSFPSVGATQNIMMAATGADGITVIKNAAKEPEIIEFGMFLNNMGACVRGMGTEQIVIKGRTDLNDTAYVLQGDRIVAGTYMAACAVCGGKIRLRGVPSQYCEAFIKVFRQMGCQAEAEENNILFCRTGRLKNPGVVETGPFPEFPTDMQSQLMSVMSLSDGIGTIRENIFESRFRHAGELRKLGADISIEGNQAVIKGVRKLCGTELVSHDLRGGAALLVAAAAAHGRTTIWDDGYIHRGYENIQRDLRLLGVHIS